MQQFGASTHVGNVRDNNEDSYVCDTARSLWIVADGMGGLGFGEVASAISTFTVTTQIRAGQGVNQAIELAHRRIKEYAESEALGANMGTTLVLLLSQGSLYNVFWVGDSRAYLFDKTLTQLSVDHSLVQTLIERGELTVEEARYDARKNAVTRALGVQEIDTVRADSISAKWRPGQKILLCSDGLSDLVAPAEIESVFCQEGTDQEKTQRLVALALAAGGKDNITVVIISAPQTIDELTSDTEAPVSADDNTYVPNHGADQHRRTSLAAPDPGQPQQLDRPPLDQVVIEPSQPGNWLIPRTWLKAVTAPIWQWRPAAGWLLGGAISLGIILGISAATTQGTIEIPAGFTFTENLFSAPPASDPTSSAKLDDSVFPEAGITLQVGLFTNLDGAEALQTSLANLELHPYVQKRVITDEIKYAVLIGPLPLTAEYASTLATLKANNVRYFHRPG